MVIPPPAPHEQTNAYEKNAAQGRRATCQLVGGKVKGDILGPSHEFQQLNRRLEVASSCPRNVASFVAVSW